MFHTLCELIPRDRDYPERVCRLTILGRVLDGTLYDVLPYHFHEERGAGGEYIPLRQRRPSVRYPLCRIVVEDSVSLLFSEGHFPTIDSNDPQVRDAFAKIVLLTHFPQPPELDTYHEHLVVARRRQWLGTRDNSKRVSVKQ